MTYARDTHSFNYHSRYQDSPCHMITGGHVDVRQLYPFWCRCWVYIPLNDRHGKVNAPSALKAHFVGYSYTTILTKMYKYYQSRKIRLKRDSGRSKKPPHTILKNKKWWRLSTHHTVFFLSMVWGGLDVPCHLVFVKFREKQTNDSALVIHRSLRWWFLWQSTCQ